MPGEILEYLQVPGRRFRVVPAVVGARCVLSLCTAPPLDLAARSGLNGRPWFESGWEVPDDHRDGWMLIEVLRPAVGDTLRLTDALDHPGLVVHLVGAFYTCSATVRPGRALGYSSHPGDQRVPEGKALEQWVTVDADHGPPTPPIDLTPLRDCWTNLTRSWGQALAVHHHSASWNATASWERRRGQWFRFLVHSTDYWRLMSLNGWRPSGMGMSMTVNLCLDALIAADRAEAGGK